MLIASCLCGKQHSACEIVSMDNKIVEDMEGCTGRQRCAQGCKEEISRIRLKDE